MDKKLHKIYIASFFIVGISVTILLAINGFQYYSTSLEERFFQPQHTSLKPSGIWGHGLGIIGSLMMIFGVAVYMIRKRIRSLFNFGYLKNWLEFHIFLCTVGPILVLYHTAFKFGGIVAVSFWSMAAVVFSGVIGRFIYVRIPKTIQGQELSIKELNILNEDLSFKLKVEYSVSDDILKKLEGFSTDKYKHGNAGSSLLLITKDYIQSRSILNQIKRELLLSKIPFKKIKEIIKLSRNKIILTRRIGMLSTMQKLFKYWHIVHLPFAIVMFVIMILHIIVTITFGYKWIF